MTNFFCIVYFLIWTVEMLKRECPTEKKGFISPNVIFITWAKFPLHPRRLQIRSNICIFFRTLYSLRIYASVMNIACKIRHSLRMEKNIKNKDSKCHFKKNIIPPKSFC